MKAERDLPAVPESVSRARRFVEQALSGLPRESVDAIALMVSELSTNCVQHARSAFHVEIDRDAQRVRIEVTDTGTGQVRRRSPSEREPHGRGLQIVDALSDDWGVIASSARPGKTVWITLRHA